MEGSLMNLAFRLRWWASFGSTLLGLYLVLMGCVFGHYDQYRDINSELVSEELLFEECVRLVAQH